MAILAGLALVALSAGLIWSHFRTRGVAGRPQFRRRLLTSGLLGLIGLAILVGQLIVAAAQPLLFIIFWLGVLAMAAALGLSGITDLIVTRGSLRRRRELARHELQRLQADLAEAQQRQREHAHLGNGDARTSKS
jgi:hypothetical protein